ncbi:MAG: hypothetical protein WA751_07640 [Candidatus Dormiibacterota bacterium]
MNPTSLQPRAWEGLCALLLWVTLTAAAGWVSFPVWADLVFPIPALVIMLDALGPAPLFVRWQVKFSPATNRRIVTVLAAVAAAVACLALVSPTPVHDQTPVITCAAQDLWHGLDPYNTYEPQCLARLHLNSAGATPLESGPFRQDTRYPPNLQIESALRTDQLQGKHAGFPAYGYPPLAPLLILPVAFTGWLGISIWVAVVSALLLLAIWGRKLGDTAPAFAWQICALALLLALYRWNPEDISYLLLALGFARIDRARLSSIAIAAAVCSNPLSWPAALVFGVITARLPERRRRWSWLGGGIALGVLPWLIWDHDLLAQLWHFVNLREFPFGASLGELARLPAQSHLLYTVGLGLGLLCCAFVAWRWPAWRWAMAVVVYGSFLLGWRGLLEYYLPILWLSPAVVLGACRLSKARGPAPLTDPLPIAAESS